MSEGRVEDIYEQLKAKAVGFDLRPGDRLNEGALARALGVSRTPLREALNRLVAEGLFDFRSGQGFYCRALDAQTIFDLYELRAILETAAIRLACARAGDADLAALHQMLHRTGLEVRGLTIAEACGRDEAFHMEIARLGGNAVMCAQLQRINERIRYIRWVSLSMGKLRRSKDEHIRIMAALQARDADTAADTINTHIGRRMDQITEAVRHGISNIYMDQPGALAEQVITEDDR